MTRAFIALGSNLGEPRTQVLHGFEAMSRIPRSELLARSRLYRSAPWGVREQPEFVNAVAELETQLGARELLEAMLRIERATGRERGGVRWGPRLLDLDLLLYGDRVMHETGLTVPHPHLHERAFVLLPLNELAPERDVPGLGPVRELTARIDARDCTPMD